MGRFSLPLLTLAFALALGVVSGQHDPHFTQNRTTIVHLFEWRWADVAEECERFLGPFGYGGVQVSPANENVIIDVPGNRRPWYERYQPISYKLETRSGTEQEFKSMVRRCNDAGVRIYVDVVLNHMSTNEWGKGVGTGGSSFDSNALTYDGVPFTAADFHNGDDCPTSDGNIQDYTDLYQMRNCKLLFLNDLNQGKEHVRERIVEFLNRLISYGVAGFRVDASKHIWPEDLSNIWGRLTNLPTDHGFPSGARAFVVHEIICIGGDEPDMIPYFPNGRVTEFKAGVYYNDIFKKLGGQQLRWLRNWGEGWDFIKDVNSVIFVDNHDNQRGHGAGLPVLNYKESRLYKMATAFTLAWPYAVTRVMSSFTFEQDFTGPPVDGNYNTLPVPINADLTCGNGWICEHRWQQIYQMVAFRNVVKGTEVNNWYDGGESGGNQIAFTRGNQGFIAMNNDNTPFVQQVPTSLPDGTYCDVYTDNFAPGCQGRTVTVSGGRVSVDIAAGIEDSVIAIHANSKL